MKTAKDWSELFFNAEGEEMTFDELVEGIQKEAWNEATGKCVEKTKDALVGGLCISEGMELVGSVKI